jgi:hypothetical protein
MTLHVGAGLSLIGTCVLPEMNLAMPDTFARTRDPPLHAACETRPYNPIILMFGRFFGRDVTQVFEPIEGGLFDGGFGKNHNSLNLL